MSGFVTQSGVILRPAAAEFHRTVAQTAPLFSYLLGGNLVGFLLCLVIFDVLTIKRVLIFAYAFLFAGVALFTSTHEYAIASVAIALIGFGAGIGLSAGALIIARTYDENRRAAAFLGTDCAFSVAGFVFPALATAAVTAGRPWQSGYVIVALIAAMLLFAALWIPFPEGRGAARVPTTRSPSAGKAAIAGVVLFGAGLCLYLCGQSAFLIWAPSYLETILAVPAAKANGIVGNFWGPSIFGLLTAGLIVTRVQPRVVLLFATTLAVLCTFVIASTGSERMFFALTLVFGFSSTCMYKLMISIGTEQVASPPPQLVTFLLLAGAIGGTIAPALSGRVVQAFGPHAGPYMAFGCYAGALAVVILALLIEKSAQRTRVTLSLSKGTAAEPPS